MAFINLRRSEWVKVEFYLAALLALVALAFSPPWWIEAALAAALSAIIAQLILSRLWIAELHPIARATVVTGAVAAVLVLIWIHIAPAGRANTFQPGPVAITIDNSTPSKSPAAMGPVEGLRRVLEGGPSNQELRVDTTKLVERLRDFQRRVDDWSTNTGKTLELENKTDVAAKDQAQLHIEHAKELSAGMYKLNQEFNAQLKPDVIVIRKRLMDRIPKRSVAPRPTVDWALKYGFSTYPNAVGDIADELQDLAKMLPQT
jgi:hypothetical protein